MEDTPDNHTTSPDSPMKESRDNDHESPGDFSRQTEDAEAENEDAAEDLPKDVRRISRSFSPVANTSTVMSRRPR